MVPVITYISASGSYTSPVGCKYIKVFFGAGGGGGGGGSATLVYGGGGGAGMAVLKYYPPGTYGITIGAGGAGGAVDVGGSDGAVSIFDTLNVVDTSTAEYGLGGDITVPQTGRGAAGTVSDGIRLAVIKSQAGADDTADFSGNGGINSLGSDSTGAYTTGLSKNGTSGRRGAGGGGGCGATGVGGDGAPGFARVTAYF
jgi:hypothetical protein